MEGYRGRMEGYRWKDGRIQVEEYMEGYRGKDRRIQGKD